MRTMLYSDLTQKKIEIPPEFKKGKIVDILIEPSEGIWTVHEVVVAKGWINKEHRFYFTYELRNIDEEDTIRIRKTMDEARKKPSESSEFYMEDINRKVVKTASGVEIGRPYDYELSLDLEPWVVWKILVDPSNLSPYKRRKRISVKKVDRIEEEKIILSE